MDIETGNKIIAAFMCGVYDGRKYMDVPEHGKCLVGPNYDNQLKYHSSWDWQVPAWSKISHLTKEVAAKSPDTYNRHIGFADRYESAVFKNNPLAGFEVIVEAIQWYDTNPNNMNIKQQIKERAEKECGMGYRYSQAYTSGALSMLPIIEDVAVEFLNWYSTTTINWNNDSGAYLYFITEVYQPK